MTLEGQKFYIGFDDSSIIIIVIRVLNDVYGLASDQAASILKQVGYSVNDVARSEIYLGG